MVDQPGLTKKQITAVAHMLFAGGSNGDSSDVASLLQNFYRDVPPEFYMEISIAVARLGEQARERAARLYLDAFGVHQGFAVGRQRASDATLKKDRE